RVSLATRPATVFAAFSVKIECAIGASGATLDLIDRLEAAGPYGSGHAQPLFSVPAHRLRDARLVGEKHVKVTLEA
ncbi:single-stranded-DNA-specific exonuclease RecJ, partial [Rhizobium ruizarguesonis]